jgi:hypothetical protein
LSGAFLYHPDSRQGRCLRLFGSLSFTEPRRSAFCRAVESRSRSQIKASDDCLGLFCITRTLARDAVPGYSAHSASRSRAEARSAAQSSPGRGANFEASDDCLGLFGIHGTLPGTLSQVIRFAPPTGRR